MKSHVFFHGCDMIDKTKMFFSAECRINIATCAIKKRTDCAMLPEYCSL